MKVINKLWNKFKFSKSIIFINRNSLYW